SRMTKVTSVQNIRPPFGDRRSPDCPDSSGATCAACRSAKMRLCIDGCSFGRSFAVNLPLSQIRIADPRCTRTASRAGKTLELERTLNQERDDDRKQRDPFDERREDDRARLNATGHLRLTSHAVHRLTGQTSDTDAGANYGETSSNARAEHAPGSGVRSIEGAALKRLRCCLQHRKDRDHFLTPFDNRDMSCSRSLDRNPSAGPSQKSPNGILQPARPDTYTELSTLRVSAHPRESAR